MKKVEIFQNLKYSRVSVLFMSLLHLYIYFLMCCGACHIPGKWCPYSLSYFVQCKKNRNVSNFIGLTGPVAALILYIHSVTALSTRSVSVCPPEGSV